MIFLLIALFICMILYEVPELVKNKYWKELAVFSILISIAFIISLAYVMNVEIPNPVRDTQYFVKDLLHLSYE